MKDDKLWAKFEKSGKVADYLRYCGVDMGETLNSTAQEEPHEIPNRGTDHSGKQ